MKKDPRIYLAQILERVERIFPGDRDSCSASRMKGVLNNHQVY
jgi:hypothetical protein